MTCDACGSNSPSRLSYFCSGGKIIKQCSDCPEKHESAPMFNRNMIKVRGAYGGKSLRTAAHDADISRRRMAPDGSVYRERGRKSFTFQ